jgi:hypothetical protein
MQDEYAREALRDLSKVVRNLVDVQKDLHIKLEELRSARLADRADLERFLERFQAKILEIFRAITEKKKSVKDLIEEAQRDKFPHYSKEGLAQEIGIDRTDLFDLQAGRHVSKNVIAKRIRSSTYLLKPL